MSLLIDVSWNDALEASAFREKKLYFTRSRCSRIRVPDVFPLIQFLWFFEKK